MSSKIVTKPVANDRCHISPSLFPSTAPQALNKYELGVIRSLFLWVATEQDTTPETIQWVTEIHFEASDIAALPRKSYDDVLRFLLDLRIEEMRD